MSFELPADLESRVADYAEGKGVAPDAAVRVLIEDGLRRTALHPKRGARLPLRTDHPERSLGAFSDMPNFVEIVADVVANRTERYSRNR